MIDDVPQLTLRYYEGMDDRLMEETLLNIEAGATYPIVYSDETTVPAMEKLYGVDREMACNWLPFGCGEYVMEGYGTGSPNSATKLPMALDLVLHQGVNSFTGVKEVDGLEDPANFKTFEELFAAYDRLLKPAMDMMAYTESIGYKVAGEEAVFPFHSLLTHDCVEKNKPLLAGGARFMTASNETFGIITCADSLTVIKEFVYDKKMFTLPELVKILDANYVGYEKERRMFQNAPKYGNDHEGADAMAKRVFDHIADMAIEAGKKTDLDLYAIVSVNNSASATMGQISSATPCGRLSGSAWSNGNSPSLGGDVNGLTATLNSMAKMDASKHLGVTHYVRFNRSMLAENKDKIKIILEAFYENNGVQTNLSSVNKGDLERALIHPEEYPDLLVRIGGFSARFVDLERCVQDEMIARTTQEAV